MLTDADSQRFEDSTRISWDVDCCEESVFLYAPVSDVTGLGVFLYTTEPLEIGTSVTLRFSGRGEEAPFALQGRVQWINSVKVLASNPNPGMGVLLLGLTPEDRERLVNVIHTIAYVHTRPN